MNTLRMLLLVVIGAGAIGAMVVSSGGGSDGTALGDDEEICLTTGLVFFEGASSGCYGRNALKKWGGASVLDNRGAPVFVNFSHPKDANHDLAIVRDCNTFGRLQRRGWYAGTSRAMRREAYFERACRSLVYLRDAVKAETSYFAEGRLSARDVAALLAGPPFRLIEAPDDIAVLPPPQRDDPRKDGLFGTLEETGPMAHAIAISIGTDSGAAQGRSDDDEAAPLAEEIGKGVWRVVGNDQRAQVQEIAHADFDNDGYGDILVYVTFGANEGTATAGRVGFLTKKAADGPLRFVQGETAAAT